MIFKATDFKCPECGGEPSGTDEIVTGVALFNPPSVEGEMVKVDYFGETKIAWNDQRTRRDNTGKLALSCGDCSNTWFAEERS
jgi:DNA-directed RNA polymerase subunit M/transcription elongation factor TFIIS